MGNIIDRRNNSNKNKNLTNRQRFVERVKGQIRESVKQNIQKGNLKDLAKGDKVRVKVKDLSEPTFSQDNDTGQHDFVVPGNTDYQQGDTIDRPKSGGKGGGKKGSLGEDESEDFSFTLTREEYMEILFEDLELPDMVKQDLRGAKMTVPERRGFTTDGNPSNLDVLRTYKNSMGRRIALKRPKLTEVKTAEEELDKLIKAGFDSDSKEVVAAIEEITRLEKKRKIISYLDPLDVRYKRFDKTPKPISNAVMFCLMDVSGSMGETEKDIAKRFFLLLYMFLTKKYESVELVFIRHTTEAEEVDENTFFYEPISGGTRISTGLTLINDIIDTRYDMNKTNIYIAQASDGGNYSDDNEDCYSIIVDKLVAKLQYFAYIEIQTSMMYGNGHSFSGQSGFFRNEDSELWDMYKKISELFKNFQVRLVSHRNEIFDVFRDLFKRKSD